MFRLVLISFQKSAFSVTRRPLPLLLYLLLVCSVDACLSWVRENAVLGKALRLPLGFR